MALPAGRYGVTKNQLLKIKKLPMNTIKLIEELTEKFDLLGSAAFKNSTSVVTDSTDLVESGAVKDIVGWGNKNLLAGMEFGVINQSTGENQPDSTQSTKRAINKIKVKRGSVVTISGFNEQSNKQIRLFYYSTDGYLRTVTSNVFSTTYLSITIPSDTDFFRFQVANVSLGINYQVEEGDTATAYEPYHASVDESKADNSVIGTVEDGATASQAYAVNDVFIRNGALCKVTSAISQGDTLSNQFTVTNVGAILTALLNA